MVKEIEAKTIMTGKISLQFSVLIFMTCNIDSFAADDVFVTMDIGSPSSVTEDSLVCNRTVTTHQKITAIRFLDQRSISVPCYCVLNHQENDTMLLHLMLILHTYSSDSDSWPVWLELSSDDWKYTEYGIPKFFVVPDAQAGAKFFTFVQNGTVSTDRQTVIHVAGVQNKVTLTCSPDGFPYNYSATSATAASTPAQVKTNPAKLPTVYSTTSTSSKPVSVSEEKGDATTDTSKDSKQVADDASLENPQKSCTAIIAAISALCAVLLILLLIALGIIVNMKRKGAATQQNENYVNVTQDPKSDNANPHQSSHEGGAYENMSEKPALNPTHEQSNMPEDKAYEQLKIENKAYENVFKDQSYSNVHDRGMDNKPYAELAINP